MLKPGELDLSIAAEFDEGFPHDYFKMLRAEAPVCWHAERDGPGHWAITRYDDLKFASRNPLLFSSWLGGSTVRDMPPEHLERSRAIMLNMDPPQHAKYRRLVQRGFTPRMIQQLGTHIREVAGEIIDRIAPRGECEFVSEVAALMPMQVICEMMGVPEEDRRNIYDLSNRLIGFDDPEFQQKAADGLQTGIEASIEMFMYASKLSERAKREPGDDIVSTLVSADVDGEKLSELDFNSFFLLLAVAGNETTRTGTSQGVRLLAAHPRQRERLVREPTLIPAAIEEIVRFNPPVMYFRRTATRDTELRGAKIRAGDKITMWYPSVNRDAAVFPDPDTFDVGRSPNEHLGFGIGEHFCLGASLARLELIIIFEELLRRLPDITVDGPVRHLRSNLIDGIKEMHVRFTPEGRGKSVAVPA
jgi:cholest-4-en-3-one 26-monooxygenase